VEAFLVGFQVKVGVALRVDPVAGEMRFGAGAGAGAAKVLSVRVVAKATKARMKRGALSKLRKLVALP
jgi:hypothetical protein